MAGWRTMALALLAVGLTTAARPDAYPRRPVELPMRFYGLRPAVEVRVNGQGPFLFLIDTGAAGVARPDVGLVTRLRLTRGGRISAAIDTVDLATLEVGPIALRVRWK